MRKKWTYKKCSIEPQSGESRYFGNANYPENKIQYVTQWWKIFFTDDTWVLCRTKEDVKEIIDTIGFKHKAA